VVIALAIVVLVLLLVYVAERGDVQALDSIAAKAEDARAGAGLTGLAPSPESPAFVGRDPGSPDSCGIETMKPGETSKVPVQSSFGWHVLHLTAVKPYTPPAFDQVKENLRRTLVKHAGEERLRTLREQAKATLMTPSGPVEWSVIPKPPAPGQAAPAGAPKVITPGPAAAKPAPQPPSGADQPDKPKGGS